MTIKDGNVASADDVLDLFGLGFKNWAQTMFNADYIGWNSKLGYDNESASGDADQWDNLLWDNFNGTSGGQVGVEDTYNLLNDSTNKTYYTPDLSGVTEYVIIEADDAIVNWSSNNCVLTKISSGKWLLYSTEVDSEVRRAQVYKSLFYGTDGSNQLILDFTNVTAMKTTHASDVGLNAYYMAQTCTVPGSMYQVNSAYITTTFNDTATNTTMSSWSLCSQINGGEVHTPHGNSKWEVPSGASPALNEQSGGGAGGTSDETGTDTSAEEKSNPATARIVSQSSKDGQGDTTTGTVRAFFLFNGTVSTVVSGDSASSDEIDFAVDNSIPNLTSAGTLSEEGALVSCLISNDVATSVTNGLAIWNSTVDATSTAVVYLSADDGSNWESVTEKEIKRLSNSGSNFKFKWEVTRTDESKKDTISEYAVLYNLGAGSA